MNNHYVAENTWPKDMFIEWFIYYTFTDSDDVRKYKTLKPYVEMLQAFNTTVEWPVPNLKSVVMGDNKTGEIIFSHTFKEDKSDH